MKRSSRAAHWMAMLLWITAGVLTPLSFAHAAPQMLCVNTGGTLGCAKTISGAVAMITAKNVAIAVAAGTYDDQVSINTGSSPKPLTLTITGTSGAASTIVNGNAAGAVFTIGSKAKVTLTGLTVTNGTGGPAQGTTGGGGILANGATLTLSECMVDGNQAALGSGIYAGDTNLTIANSSITANVGQGNFSQGGGIYFNSAKTHKLSVIGSTIDGNSAASGGGVSLVGGTSTIIRLSATVSNSTISNNVSPTTPNVSGSGAGLQIQFAKLTMTNSTFSGNNATGIASSAGAIGTFVAEVFLNDVTIAHNSAGSIGGGINANVNDPKFVISNTIIADNQATAAADCEAGTDKPITSLDYNFIGDPSTCALKGKTAHNLSGDPMLGPLQNNGGTTETQALLAGSTALGAGNPGPTNGKGGHCTRLDQIGTKRTKGDCDMGAYQFPD
jgi:fibronectin-binding autotransporter adhesin